MWSSGGNAASAWEAVRRYKESASFGGLEMENMNGVMTGIIEVKPTSHGALDELVESPPFQGGIYGFEPHTHHQDMEVLECEQVLFHVWYIEEIPVSRRLGRSHCA